MPCYKPNLAFQHKKVKQSLRFVGRKHHRNQDGKDPYDTPEYAYYSRHSDWTPLVLPCGQCVHCRLQNARQKAIRATHEASLYENNCFITLTYNNENLPQNGSIDPKHVQEFMKKLRRRFDGTYLYKDQLLPKIEIRSMGCAEYGERLSRPHYHLCLFNFDFKDKYPHRMSGNDWSKEKHLAYRSELLEELWTYGYSEIGTLTFESAAYVARYISKKINGDKKDEHYGNRLPERSVAVSNRKGIGLPFLEKYHQEMLANDSVILKGKQHKLPRYYDKKLEQMFPEQFLKIKEKRLDSIKEIDLDSTKQRLKVRERIHELKKLRLKRGYETNET